MKNIIIIVLFWGIFLAGSFMAAHAAEGDAAEGKTQFQNICASCHGPEGKGDGVAAAALDPKPRDLGNAEIMSKMTDEHLFKVIKEGGASVGLSPMMAAWGGVLNDQQIWDVIAYIRTDLCKCEYEKE